MYLIHLTINNTQPIYQTQFSKDIHTMHFNNLKCLSMHIDNPTGNMPRKTISDNKINSQTQGKAKRVYLKVKALFYSSITTLKKYKLKHKSENKDLNSLVCGKFFKLGSLRNTN